MLMGWHGRTTTVTGRAKLLVMASNFFSFRIMFGQIPAKQIKITQNKQNKSNKTCGFPPTKRSFNVISLTIKRFIYPIPNLSLRDNDIKLTLAPESHMTLSIISDFMTHGLEKFSRSLSLDDNLFWMISINFLNCSSNLDLSNPCGKGIFGLYGGGVLGFSLSTITFSLCGFYSLPQPQLSWFPQRGPLIVYHF